MSIVREKVYPINSSDNGYNALKNIAEDWGKPYEKDGNAAIKIYLDQEQGVYLRINTYVGATTSPNLEVTLNSGGTGRNVIYDSGIKMTRIFSDRNPDGNVLYFLGENASTSSAAAFIVSKDNGGNWVCLTKNKMVTETGVYTFETEFVRPDDSLPYSAFVMPNVANGKKFDTLLKMFTARTKSKSNLYVAFNDKPYRVVTVNPGLSTDADYDNPSYAFEARQA